MKIAFLNASISRRAGGVFEVQRRLAQNLQHYPDVNIQVLGLEDEHTQKDLPLWAPYQPQVHQIKGPEGFGFSPTLLPALKKSGAELTHLHVLWMYPSVACIKSNIPFITTIHGMLDQWALRNSGLKKKVAATLYEKKALQKAACLQAFTEQEYRDIRGFGIKTPVCIIPNGVDLPADVELLKREDPVWKAQVPPFKKVMLYLGRIHPKKGLTNLVQAWEKVQQEKGKDWVLAIAGWDQGGYEAELKQMVGKAGLQDSILFLGPQFNRQKDLCFAHASAFVLPSFSEGLPMAVLEAWAYGLPVVMTAQCNLPAGFEQGAALQTETTVESIATTLSRLFSLTDAERTAMGAAGMKLVKAQFTWEKVAQEMYEVYKWILDKGPKPETVILS